MTTLAVLALGACGTAKTDAGGEQAVRAEAVGSRQSAEGPQTGESRQSAPTLAELREYIERTCPAPGTPPVAPPVPGPPAGGPSSMPTALPPGERPPVEPVMPTAGPEVELDGRDWCAGVHHEQRVAEALLDLADPTPAKVRTILGGLDYADDRVHGLKQSGATTLFFVDLREKGGKLCLEGTAAGAETVVDKCVAPATGPFAPGDREL